ncbi:hypothetical protein WICPIJ_009599 [Wickerhamomyces pijperi]|uniref:Uncharacterized protein n=1 Tax=Wickerhamomyces pijperi TaxID=599730 RepID=A0A9P8PLD1_WICPI|nr:hypothetical protein WICPIJ_009599 [Wickerhamomyces pijperi]
MWDARECGSEINLACDCGAEEEAEEEGVARTTFKVSVMSRNSSLLVYLIPALRHGTASKDCEELPLNFVEFPEAEDALPTEPDT